MFGLFKKRDTDKDQVRAAIRQEFDATIALARVAPLSKQARVGKGIIDALATFDQAYTKDEFQSLSLPERISFMEVIRKRQDELRLMGGDVSIEHIGYSLISRWLIAVAMGDDEIVQHFDNNMAYFKRASSAL